MKEDELFHPLSIHHICVFFLFDGCVVLESRVLAQLAAAFYPFFLKAVSDILNFTHRSQPAVPSRTTIIRTEGCRDANLPPGILCPIEEATFLWGGCGLQEPTKHPPVLSKTNQSNCEYTTMYLNTQRIISESSNMDDCLN